MLYKQTRKAVVKNVFLPASRILEIFLFFKETNVLLDNKKNVTNTLAILFRNAGEIFSLNWPLV